MDGTRIYIGNLSPDFKDKDLENLFSQYGTISKLEIKDKLDFDGNSISRFAYLNLVSNEHDLQKCVQTLDGKNVNGSWLKVELARESFLERLKRERQEKQSNNNQSSNKHQNNRNFNDKDYNFSTQSPYEKKKSDFLQKQELETDNYDHSFNRESKSRKLTNYKSEFKTDAEDELRDENKVPNEYTFTIQSVFKRYDPTTEKSYETSDKKEVKKNADASKKFVEISSDLKFHDNSPGTFSLLSKFSSQQEAAPKKGDAPVQERPSYLNSRETSPEAKVPISENGMLKGKKSSLGKKKNFFISANDPNLQAGAEWLLTPLTDKNLEEFKEIRQELVTIYQTQNESAKRNSKFMPRKSHKQRKKNS